MKNGLRVTHGRVAESRGFTLLELMVVLVVIGILAAIAYPSYQDQVRKTRRADGKGVLMDTAQQLERCYTRFARYTHADCDVGFPIDSPEGFYRVTAAALNTSNFTLDATPQGDQARDVACGTLRLNNRGVQGSQGANADANNCW